MYCAIQGRLDIAKLITNSKKGSEVDVLAEGNQGNTAADLARQHKNIDIEEYFRDQFL